TIAVSDSGGGGRFASLLASHPNSSTILCDAVLTSQTSRTAGELAVSARSGTGASLGLGILVEVSDVGNRIYEGTITVALDGAETREERFPMRAAFEEMQRRAAMTAADVLRRALLHLD
ncbi:MAG: hypothetical protein ACR2OO_07805, partial [Thermomicrobiales bacterium]